MNSLLWFAALMINQHFVSNKLYLVSTGSKGVKKKLRDNEHSYDGKRSKINKSKEEKGADYGNMNLNIELNPGEKVTVSRTENKAEENIHLSIKKVIKNETKDENNKNAARENQIKQKNSVGKTERQNSNQMDNERDTLKQQEYKSNKQKPEQQVNEIEKQKNYLEPKKENQRETDDINPILQDSNKV